MDTAIAETVRRVMIANQTDIVAAYVFGSRAQGTARRTSDVDVAVLFAQPPAPALDGPAGRLQRALERELATTVDFVTLDTAPADLVHRVLRDGLLVYEGDRQRRIAFETKKRAEYLDLLPHLRRYRRAEVV